MGHSLENLIHSHLQPKKIKLIVKSITVNRNHSSKNKPVNHKMNSDLFIFQLLLSKMHLLLSQEPSVTDPIDCYYKENNHILNS